MAETRWVIVDTGPLVAFLDRGETHHAWIRERSREIEAPWMTCEAVLSEAWYLLRRVPVAQDALLEMVAAGFVEIGLSLREQIYEVRALQAAYRDVPMSLADACLVRMAELNGTHSICTLDSDFRIYRKHGREPIPVLIPPS